MQYEHIFFDLDRTLWDFETNSNETLYELSHKYKLIEKGVSSIDEFITAYFHINEQMWDDYRRNLIDKHTLRYERFHKTLMKFGISDRRLTENIGNDYVAISPLKTNLFPHTKEVLNHLHDKYSLHIITNGFEEVQHIKIKNCGIGHFFEEIITSERAGFKKPDKRIFEYSLDAADTHPKKAIMIGDSLDADIVGARSAGMDQIYFNPKENEHSETITHEIKSLNELMDLL